MRRRRKVIDIEVDHDRWLVSYSDFVTLLFAFFVVMYSISQVNDGKYRILSDELLQAFNVRQSAINPIQVGDPTITSNPSAITENKNGSTPISESAKETDLSLIEKQLSQQFSDLVAENKVKIFGNELWLEIELDSNVLFSSAQAEPSLQAKSIFEDVSHILSKFNNPVQVEGFTDNVPINNRRFNNNWELSSARAAAVVNLLELNGIAPERLSAVGYGEYRPIADNSTVQGRAENRRVVLMISKEKTDRPRLGSQSEIDNVLSPALSEATSVAEEILSNDKSTTAEIESTQAEPLITPIKLESGGLLFTSDPELRRQNLNGENSAESE